MNKITTLLLSIALSGSAIAADKSTQTESDWYVSPLGSYIKSDQSRNTEDHGANIKFGLGKEVSDSFNLELGVNGNWLDRSQDPYLKQIGLELDALYFFDRESVFSPYIATGVGMLETKASEDTNPTWSAGLGLLTELDFLKDAKLRTEVRFQQEFDTSNFVHDDVLLRAGVQIPFGSSPVVIPKPLPKDSDGDSVNDQDDKCPATPAGTSVNAYGCELDSDNDGVVDGKDDCPNTLSGTSVDSRGCAIAQDSDSDGVTDETDQCPDTLPGTPVNAYGCPLDPDDDNDGVANSEDQCPNTVQAVRVDFKGCEIKDVISLPGINFESNSATLTPNSAYTLDGAAETLIKFTDITAEVAGHTDSIGEVGYNLSLSERRAISVRNYLIRKGVPASRLTAKGYGESQPIADNTYKPGRAINRRVDLNIRK